MIKPDELHNMKDAEIAEEVERLRKRVFELRSQKTTEKLENPRQIADNRRDIARLLTEQRSRELAANPKTQLKGSRAERKAQRAALVEQQSQNQAQNQAQATNAA